MMKNDAWVWEPLGDLFEIGAGKTMSQAAREGIGKVPFLRTSNVLWDEIDLNQLDEMALSPEELQEKCVQKGDLLVCEGGEIGRAAVWEDDLDPIAFQNHIHRLRPKSDGVHPRFFVFFLQSAFTQLGIFEGAGNKTTIPNISRNRLASLEVPHPPLAEQRAIAQVLALVRDGIRGHRNSLAHAEEMKAAAMRELFTRGLGGEPQKETEIGLVPESWEEVPIGELGRVITGTTPSTKRREYYDGGNVPFITPGDFEHGNPIKTTEKRISSAGLKVSRPVVLGSTCVVCIGSSIGKVGITTAAISTTNQQINVIETGEGVESRFAFHLLTFFADHIRSQASPSPVPILSKGAFEQICLFSTRDREEQREIADILDAIDRKIDLHRRKRVLLEELFKSLLHKLMTGEVRVSDLDLSALSEPALGKKLDRKG